MGGPMGGMGGPMGGMGGMPGQLELRINKYINK